MHYAPSKPALRAAHAVSLDHKGRIVPEVRLSYAETAALEARGYEILRQDLTGTWGEFGTLARTRDGKHYLLALA